MLGDAGIQLGEANVSAGSPQQQESHSERRHTSQALGNTGDTLNAPLPATTTSLRISREGLIDTFA
jgi:flagellar hook-length control protein FliK